AGTAGSRRPFSKSLPCKATDSTGPAKAGPSDLCRMGGTPFAVPQAGGLNMLHMALVFLVIGILAALLGFTTIAGASFAIAKFLAGLFLILFLVFLIVAMTAANRIVH